MWLLTVDPLIRISVFIAKLPNDKTAGVFSRTFTVKKNSKSLTYTVASSCVCTSPLAVMTIVALHDFVNVSISAEFKSFLLIMCIDAPESTTKSRSSGLSFDAGRHLFSEGEKGAALFFSFTFRTLLASFHAASRAPSSCHCVSSWDRSSNFGALELRWWGSPGQIIPSEGFWSRVSAWRNTASVNRTDWLQHVWSLPQNRWRLRRLHILTYAIQLSCNFQYSHCTFVTMLLGPFARLFINLAMRIRALLTKSASFLGLVEQAFWEDAIFRRMNWCKFLWGNLQGHRDILPLGLLPLGLRVLDAFFTLCCEEDSGEGFGCVDPARLFVSCRKLQLSPCEHCPLASHCQQSPRILCSRCFILWFLTTALVSKFPFLAPKFLFRTSCSILLFTIVFNLW